MSNSVRIIVFSVFVYVFTAFGQSVSFHKPVPWITVRDAKISTKLIVDTAGPAPKSVSVTLYQFKNGKKQKIAKKNIAYEDATQDVVFGTVKEKFVGGEDYFQIEWEIVKDSTTKQGILSPFGLSQYTLGQGETVTSETGKKSEKKAGVVPFSVSHDKNSIQITVSDLNTVESFTFCVDPKNGKNAFRSYPDRYITYNTVDGSVECFYVDRTLTDGKVEYKRKLWNQEVSTKKEGNSVVITIPYYDLNMKYNTGRVLGASLVVTGKDGKSYNWPSGGNQYIPGTWGNIKIAN